MPIDLKAALVEIDRVLEEAEKIQVEIRQVAGRGVSGPNSWMTGEPLSPRVSTKRDTSDVARATTLLASAIHRFGPPGSAARSQCDAILDRLGIANEHGREQLIGILRSIRFEYENGSLGSIVELIHRDLFSDFIEMARHLLEQGYKDPAAVIASGVLEQHLRELARKHGVGLMKANGDPKSGQLLNDDLRKFDAYDVPTKKEVTSLLATRNHASHGEYEKYDLAHVRLYIDRIALFLEKNPA